VSIPFSLTSNSRLDYGANALAAPTTPGHRVAVVDRSKVDPGTLQAAEGMEAMFLDYMMKVMRETVPKNDMDLESSASGIYRSLQDSEIAHKAAKQGGIGLADQLIAYLESQRYTLPREHGVPAGAESSKAVEGSKSSGTGGTHHEGQPVQR
jgi:Rod binding domain-containing protein